MKRAFAGWVALSVLLCASGAMAADLSVAPLYKAPPAPTPAYDWSGFYAGVNGGGGWGHSWWNTNATGLPLSGGQAGGTAGYNWQLNNVVLGVEGDIDWSGLSGSATTPGCPGGCSTSESWLSTVRGRVGYSFGRVMPYVTGGLAVGDIRAATPGFTGATPSILDGPSAAALSSPCPATGLQRRNTSTSASVTSTAPAAPPCRPITFRCSRTYSAPA